MKFENRQNDGGLGSSSVNNFVYVFDIKLI